MSELMGKYAYRGIPGTQEIFRLNGILVDGYTIVDTRTATITEIGPAVEVPCVRPDGIIIRAALLAAPGMDDHNHVDLSVAVIIESAEIEPAGIRPVDRLANECGRPYIVAFAIVRAVISDII